MKEIMLVGKLVSVTPEKWQGERSRCVISVPDGGNVPWQYAVSVPTTAAAGLVIGAETVIVVKQ